MSDLKKKGPFIYQIKGKKCKVFEVLFKKMFDKIEGKIIIDICKLRKANITLPFYYRCYNQFKRY